MTLWRRLVGDRPIVTRLVLAVAVTMSAVLLMAGGFVFWRVAYALNRQLDQDLDAYQQVVQRAASNGSAVPTDTPGQTYQVYDLQGHITSGSATSQLVDRDLILQAVEGSERRVDVGHLIPASDHPYRVVVDRVVTPSGPVVVASAISKHKHDEALRELLLQLAFTDLLTLAAASLVGYGTARAALNPVERYRVAAEHSDGNRLLPVAADKDDEIARLGHTFNALLDRIRQANDRERQFLADASHELRSPLALMRTELEWALLRPRDEAGRAAAFESIRTQVDRLITVSNALLELEELRAEGDSPQDPIDVGLLLGDVAVQFADQALAEGRHIQTTAPAGLVAVGNQHWLSLALSNLVSNTLRYGQGTIHLEAALKAEGIRLSVRDEGAGFSPEFVDRAFDRFSRADRSRTSGGTGLGLALVQAVAEAHGGTASIAGAQVSLDMPQRPSRD